jgi:N-acetylmuramoyl-L-alanine amidase
VNLKEKLIPIDLKCRPGIILSEVKSITIHWIGPFPNQTCNIVRGYWVDNNLEASAHYIIKNEDIMQTIPDEEVAWHCGSRGNYSSIGIEVIPMDKNGQFSAASIATLRELVWAKEWQNKIFMRHYDWTKKDCPKYYTPLIDGGDDHWKELINELTKLA